MANEGYDKDSDSQNNPFGNDKKSKAKSVSPDRLNQYESQPEKSNNDAGEAFGKDRDTGSAENAFGSDRGSGEASNSFGKGRSSSGGASEAFGDSGDTDSNNAFGSGKSLYNGKGSRFNLRRYLKKRNIIIAAPVAIAVGLLFLLMLIASSLKLPDIMQQITAYEFARSTTQFAQDSEEVTDESLALEATNDSTLQALKKNFTETVPSLYKNIRDTTWGRLDAYRPSQVIETLGEKNGLTFNFKTSFTGSRKILTSVSVEDVNKVVHTYEIPETTSFAKWVPGLNRVLETKNSTAFLSKSDFLSIVNNDMDANQVSTLVRGATLSKIIGIAGGSRAGWALSKFLGLDEEDSRIEASIQTYDATQAGATNPDDATTSEIKDADSAASDATNTEVQDWQPGKSSELDQTVNSGIDQGAEKAAEGAVDSNLLTTTLDFANPVYGIFTPLCIIYDGSVKQSQPTIDNQMNQEEDAFDQLNAEAGEQEKGDQSGDNATELTNAVGGTNAEIGDTTQSIPYQRSEGETPDTADQPAVEAGSDGSYTYSIEDALDLSGVEATAINILAGGGGFTSADVDFVTQQVCSALTNTGVAAALAGANLVAAILSFGATEAGEEAAGRGAVDFITAFAKDIASNIIPDKTVTEGTTVITRSALARAKAFVWEKGINLAKPFAYITSLTVLAKMIVDARSGEATNGLAQNSDLVNEADDGANIEGNKVEQSQEFGRPLLTSEVMQANKQSAQYVDAQNASKSFSERYFALSNANSLLSHMAIDLNGEISGGFFNSIFKIATAIFRPFNAVGSLFSLNNSAVAAPDPSTEDYGNVQFGWTQAEINLINSNTSYKPLENQHILDEDENGKVEQEIAQKYAMCFGYSYDSSGNGDLDPTDPNGDLQLSASDSLGNLLAGTAPAPPGVSPPTTTGYIARNADGDVINVSSALCSPENLSYDSPDPLADNPWSTNGKTHDMIFRWRLAMAYDTTLDQLISEQSVVSQ